MRQDTRIKLTNDCCDESWLTTYIKDSVAARLRNHTQAYTTSNSQLKRAYSTELLSTWCEVKTNNNLCCIDALDCCECCQKTNLDIRQVQYSTLQYSTIPCKGKTERTAVQRYLVAHHEDGRLQPCYNQRSSNAYPSTAL